MSRRLLWFSLVGVLALAGCSSTEPAADPPDVQGQYAGTWTFTAARPDGTIDFTQSCPCTFAITRQQGYLFSGMNTFQAPCGGEIPVTGGRIEVDGRIQFEILANLLQGMGCSIVTQPLMTGTYSAGTIAVQRAEEYDCTTALGVRYTLTVRANFTRT